MRKLNFNKKVELQIKKAEIKIAEIKREEVRKES